MRAAFPLFADTIRLDRVARDALARDDRRIVIVGASGWLGRTLLAGLFEALGEGRARARIACFGSSERMIDIGGNRAIGQLPLSALASLPSRPTHLFHLAFLTKDKVSGMTEESYIAANRELSARVHDALDAIGADRLFVASSGAAAFADDEAAAHQLRLYGGLKREDEVHFEGWARAASGRRAAIARIYSVTGPFINKHDTYAIASFILDALSGQPITVNAPMPVVRSYVALRELHSLVIAILLDEAGPVLTRFDSGGEALELGEVADRVAQVLGGHVRRAGIESDDAQIYAGSGKDYARLLHSRGMSHLGLAEQIVETAAFLEASGEAGLVADNRSC